MTRANWTEVDAGTFDPAPPRRALAYWSRGGKFALYNDYQNPASFLVRHPSEGGMGPVGALWASDDAPGGPRRLAIASEGEGYGVFTFPFGPITEGVPEAGRFDLKTYGERILGAEPIGGYKRRRILDAVAGLPIEDAALRIERTAGNFAAAHVSAFLGAAEAALGRSVAVGELWTRALAQELQRIYNHVHLIARIAEAAAQNLGVAQAHALAEEMLRFQGDVFGHRWSFGALVPGGPTRHLARSDRAKLPARLGTIERRFEELWSLFLGSRTFIDRIQATAEIARDRAIALGAVGPTLRACGVAWDDRLRVPTVPYSDLFVELPREDGGDALARVLVRADEVRSSLSLLEQLLDRWPGAPDEPVPPEPAVGPNAGLGRVEAPSGDLVYEVEVAEGRVARVGCRTPSQANFPALAEGLNGAVFTDFHFAFESFGLVFAEVDR